MYSFNLFIGFFLFIFTTECALLSNLLDFTGRDLAKNIYEPRLVYFEKSTFSTKSWLTCTGHTKNKQTSMQPPDTI